MDSTYDIQNARAQMRKGMIEFCTILVISRGPIYASDILDALKKANLLVVEGTLYPLLSRLKSAGLLAYSWEESKAGPPRKYYTLTAEGKLALKNLKHSWQEFSQSIETLIAE